MQDRLRAPTSDATSKGRRCSARRTLLQTHPQRLTEHTQPVRLTKERDETLQPEDRMGGHSYRVRREHRPPGMPRIPQARSFFLFYAWIVTRK